MPPHRIMILSGLNHAEGKAVRERLDPRRVLYIDDGWLRASRTLQLTMTDAGEMTLRLDEETVGVDDIGGVFLRPSHRRGTDGLPTPVLLSAAAELAPEFHRFGQAEAEATLVAALASSRALWVNHPAAELMADRKLAQLEVAGQAGLRVPRTIASNDVGELTRFWEEMDGEVITKAVSNNPATLLHIPLVTRRVTRGDLAVLAGTAPGVTLFQEHIPASLDLRVTMVGETVFATEIHSQDGTSPLDWRLDQTVRMRPHPLDPGLARALRTVRRRLGLVYGAADLRLTPDGTPVFLEINAQGSFMFVERITGAPVSKALAELLARPGSGDDGGQGCAIPSAI